MRRTLLSFLALSLPLVVSACASNGSRPKGIVIERGIASWYGPGFHGRFTASGERYDMDAMTAAHQSLPFGTVVEVRNLDNGKTARVRINDRGPFMKGRILDLSRAAAKALGIFGPGTAPVELIAMGIEPLGGFSFTVQVGAFRDAARARQLADQLRAYFPGVEVRHGDAWSRVQVGAFSNRNEAHAFAGRLAALGYPAVVVPLAQVDVGKTPSSAPG